MAAYNPIAFIAPNYRDFNNYWLKLYTPGTTSPIQMSIDAIGTTFFAKVQLDTNGFLTTDGTTLFIPYAATKYDAYLFPTEAEADANNTVNAIRVADDITPAGASSTEGDLVLSTPFSFTASIDPQTAFDLGATFGTNPTVTNVFVQGRQQDAIGNGSSAVAFTLSGTVITLSEGVPIGTLVTGTANSLTSTVQALPSGARGNPHPFDTKSLLEATGDTLAIGSWVEIKGDNSKFDGDNALYLIVDDGDVGAAEDRIIQLTNRKAFRFYTGAESGGTTVVDNFPYDFKFPTNDTERAEMLALVGDDSMGYGGSTWWLNAPMGRTENNVNVIYRGSTYGTPENRDLIQGSTDFTLFTNKKLGEAVKKLTRLVYAGGSDPIEFSLVGINDKLISFREDEHQQPSVMFNNKNGQIIVNSGSRNDARSQDGVNVSNFNYVRYGQDSNTLSVSETIEYTSNADYAQGFFVGSTAYWFQRVDIGEWHFIRGSGGQNYNGNTPDSTQFFDPSTDQYYFNIAVVDKTQDPTVDPQSSTDRTKVHFFGQAHPTNSPDRILRYAVGTFILANQEPSPREGGGLFMTKIDGTTQLGSNTVGRLDTTFLPFVKADMDTAYTAPVGSSYRLLDVQYGDTPSALIVEFVLDWTHGDSVPYQKTWTLKQVRYNGATWDVLDIATSKRGLLGYEPQANAIPSGNGVEGYTSFYAYGACYQRSKMHSDLLPVIYYCDRAGDAKDTYQLHKVTLNAGYTAVSTDVIIKTSDKILYRPESTLYGDKRVLWYNSAEGWSSFSSWVAQDKFLNEV